MYFTVNVPTPKVEGLITDPEVNATPLQVPPVVAEGLKYWFKSNEVVVTQIKLGIAKLAETLF